MKSIWFFIILVSGAILEVSRCDELVDECAGDEFMCTDKKRCISNADVCDDYPNCLDYSDEDETLCETWEYDYETEDEEGGWWGSWAAGGDDDDYEDDDIDVPSVWDDEDELTSVFEETVVEEGPPQMCSTKKCSASGVLSFLDEYQYEYLYEVTAQTELKKNSQTTEVSAVTIKADVMLQVLTACEMSIQLENVVSMTSTPDSGGDPIKTLQENNFIKDLTSKPLRFAMVSGQIEEVCASPGESSASLNFKKGLISMLQNSMPVLHLPYQTVEKDIMGECEINYDFAGAKGSHTIVSKKRNTETCKGRSHLRTSAIGVPYEFPGATANIPIIDSTSECEQEILKGVIRSAVCNDKNSLSPLTSEQDGITSSVRQQLTYTGGIFSTPTYGKIGERTNLLYTFVSPQSESQEANGDQQQRLEEMFASMQSLDGRSVQLRQAEILAETVAIMKKMTTTSLNSFYQGRSWIGPHDTQLLFDSLPLVGTAASIHLMTDLISKKEVDPETSSLWAYSLMTVADPTEDILEAASDMLSLQEVPNEAVLSVGGLVNSYCANHPLSCSSHQQIKQILATYNSFISTGCTKSTSAEKIQVLLALKGIGNAGVSLQDVSSSEVTNLLENLNECIQKTENEVEIRVAAIEAFRRFPCEVSRRSLKKIFTDPLQDSELRIASYLNLMSCADYEITAFVEEVLHNEEVNQVGSFVWTHLTNLKESGLPTKADIQALLSNREFEEKFQNDFRKFSRNIEWSGFYDEINAGAAVESNVIFSQTSYVPRSASLNVTLDLFGRSFNVFEIGTRFEGFDRYLNSLLESTMFPKASPEPEPQGGINNPHINQMIAKSNFAREYKEKDAELSFNMKLFGNDFFYKHFHGMDNIQSYFEYWKPDQILGILRTGEEFSLHKSWMPLDSSYLLATSAGLPLSINLEGTAAVDVSAMAQMDLMQMLTTGEGQIQGHLKPNVNVNARATLLLDAHSGQTGVELKADFQSSMVLDGRIQLNGMKVVSVDFNVPHDVVEIFNIKTELLMVHQSADNTNVDQTMTRSQLTLADASYISKEGCSPFAAQIGSKLCWTVKVPQVTSGSTLRTLLHGPINFAVVFRKEDPSISSYSFRYQFENENDFTTFLLSLDTPGTTISREHSLRLTLNYNQRDVFFRLKAPSYFIEFKGRSTWIPSAKKLYGFLNLNDDGGAAIDIGYRTYGKNNQQNIIPLFKVTWANEEIITITGELVAKDRPEGNLGTAFLDFYYSVNLSFGIKLGSLTEGTIIGSLNILDDNFEANLKISYSLTDKKGNRKKDEQIAINYERVMKISNGLTKYDGNWKIVFTEFPNLNCKGKLASKTFQGTTENLLQINFGENYENPQYRVDVYQNLAFYGGFDNTYFNASLGIMYPNKNLDIKIGADLAYDRANFNGGFILQYATDKAMSTRFTILNTSVDGKPVTTLDCHFIVPMWVNIQAQGSFVQQDVNVYKFDFTGIYGNAYRISLDGIYRDLSTNLKALHRVEFQLILPNINPIDVSSTFLYELNQIALLAEVKLFSGQSYKIRLAYITSKTDLSTLSKRIELDLHIGQQLYYWHAKITKEEHLTIANDIHIDSLRDINLWIQIQREKENYFSLEVKLNWDANRDPLKKAFSKMVITANSVSFVSSIAFLGSEYRAEWDSQRKYLIDGVDTIRNYDHKAVLSWKDDLRVLHELTGGAKFSMRRGDGAHISSYIYLMTPFEEWKNNSMHILYSRDKDHIHASMESEWHKNEFMTSRLSFEKMIQTSKDFSLDAILDMQSSIKGLFSFSLGGKIQRKDKIFDSNGFIQWEQDKIQVMIEAEDARTPLETRFILSGKVMTTLLGYEVMGTYLDASVMTGQLNLHSSAKWNDASYEMKAIGQLNSAKDYLKGEMTLSTPDSPNTAALSLRVYHDPISREERIELVSIWYEEEYYLKGRFKNVEYQYGIGIGLRTPFERLPQVSLDINLIILDECKVEAIIYWKDSNALGINSLVKLNSLTDFIIRASVVTPFADYKEISGELSNLFRLSPHVEVRSKIYGQRNDKKVGLGGRYEHADSSAAAMDDVPRLRVGLEIYSPIENFREVTLDFADNSIPENLKYLLEMSYGSDKEIKIESNFKKEEYLNEAFIKSDFSFPFLGPEYEFITISSGAKLAWGDTNDFEVHLLSKSKTKTIKIVTKGSVSEDKGGSIEGSLILPLEDFEDIQFACNYRPLRADLDGLFDLKMKIGSQKKISLNVRGRYGEMTASFSSPFKHFSEGSFRYKLFPVDVVKSRIDVSAMLEGQKISMDGQVYFNQDNYITKLEGILETPFKGFEAAEVKIDGHSQGESFVNKFSLSGTDTKYSADIIWDYNSEMDWKIKIQATKSDTNGDVDYSGELELRTGFRKPLRVAINFQTPKSLIGQRSFEIEVQSNNLPYNIVIKWNLEGSHGSLDFTMREFLSNKISYMATFGIQRDKEFHQVTLDFELLNKNPPDHPVDNSVDFKISTNHERWNELSVSGKLKEVTDDPGLLFISVKWPQMEPVVFEVTADYQSDPTSTNLIVSSRLDMNLTNYKARFDVNREIGNLGFSTKLSWMNPNDSLSLKEANLIGSFTFMKRKLDGTIELSLPPGYNSMDSSVELHYESDKGMEKFKVALNIANRNTLIEGESKPTKPVGTEGHFRFQSDIFWDNKPLTLSHSWTISKTQKIIGDYKLEWPKWDNMEKKYKVEAIQALLTHEFQIGGRFEGSLQLLIPATKGKPITLFYQYTYSGYDELTLVTGVKYKTITLEVKYRIVETVTPETAAYRKELEIDNPLWPFGVAYIYAISTLDDEAENLKMTTPESPVLKFSEKFAVYDLTNPGRQSELSFTKQIINEGKKFIIKANLINREIELSGGYRWGELTKGIETLLSWGPTQWISSNFVLTDNSKFPDRQFDLIGNFSHPLQTSLLKGSLTKKMDNIVGDLVLNWDYNDLDEKPITVTLASVKQGNNYMTTLGLKYDSTLQRPIELEVNFQKNLGSSFPHSLECSLIYSDDEDEKLTISYDVNLSVQNAYSYEMTMTHPSTQFYLNAEGNIIKSYPTFSVHQEVVYSNYTGYQHKITLAAEMDLSLKVLAAQIEQENEGTNLDISINENSPGDWQLLASGSQVSHNMASSVSFQPNHKTFVLTLDNLRSSSLEELASDEKARFLADKMTIKGGYADQRYTHLSIEHEFPTSLEPSESGEEILKEPLITTDATFFLRLNHTRLLSSHARWRTELLHELKNEAELLLGESLELRSSVKQWMGALSSLVKEEILNRSTPIFQNVLVALSPLRTEFRNKSKDFKTSLITMIKNTNLSTQERDHLNALGYLKTNLMRTLNDIELVKSIKAKLAKGTLRQQISAQIAKVKASLSSLLRKDGSNEGLSGMIQSALQWVIATSKENARRAYLTFTAAVRDFKERLRDWLRNKWHNVYYNYKPHIMQTFHVLETAAHHFVTKVWGHMSHLRTDFQSLSYVQSLQEIYRRAQEIYKGISERSLKENLSFLCDYFASSVKRTTKLILKGVLPFVDDWLEDVKKAWVQLNSFAYVNAVTQFAQELWQKTCWFIDQLNIRDKILSATAFLIEKGTVIARQTSLEAQMRHIIPKTGMMWYPTEGRIEFDQKLPFTWNSFEEKPNWKEMFELPILKRIKSIFYTSTQTTVLDTWYKYFNLNFYPSSWVPPFPAKGYVIGNNNFLTFDGRWLNLKGDCEYVLAVDRVHAQWAVTIKYHHTDTKTIHIYVDGKDVEFSSQYKVKVNGELIGVPFEESSIEVWRSTGGLNLLHNSGLFIYWNLENDVFSVTIPETKFLHTAGLLGTYNNEPYDDLLTPNELISEEDQLTSFLEAWEVYSDGCRTSIQKTEDLVPSKDCEDLFESSLSPFKYCLYQVDPRPFHKICQSEYLGSKDTTCSTSFAYREKCSENHIPVKIPEYCVRCQYVEAPSEPPQKLLEGDSVLLKKENALPATDVVLVLERKPCNKELQDKYFKRFLVAFEEGLKKEGIASTRYALVTYAGSSVDSTPVVASIDYNVFTSAKDIPKIINKLNFDENDSIPSEEVAFHAINFATGLPFRPAVGVTLLFFPCHPCHTSPRFDIETIYHILASSRASLHVFKKGPFDIQKSSLEGKIIGYDQTKAYQLKDYKKKIMGSGAIQKHIETPKQELQYCSPLALDSNGTIYTTQILSSKRKKQVERFGTIVGRKAAQTALQEFDHRCTCFSTQEVTPIMRCDKYDKGDFSILENYGLEFGTSFTFDGKYPHEVEDFYENEL